MGGGSTAFSACLVVGGDTSMFSAAVSAFSAASTLSEGGSTACSAFVLRRVVTSMFLSALSAFSAALAASSREAFHPARRHCLDDPFRNGRSGGEGGLPNPRLSLTHKITPFKQTSCSCFKVK